MKLKPSHVAFVLALALLLLVTAVGAWAWRALDEQQNERLRQARFQFSLNDVRDTLNASLQLGVSLPNLPNAQARLDAAFKQHADVLSMDVADASGQIVFSTDASGVGARVPGAWVAACVANASTSSGAEAQVHGRSADAQWRCTPLLDGIGQAVGVVVLRYGGADSAGLAAKSQGRSGGNSLGLLHQAGTWWALSLALALLGAAWVAGALRGLDARLAEEAAIAKQATNAKAEAGSLDPQASAQQHPGLAPLHALHRKLAEAESQIDAMDGAEVG